MKLRRALILLLFIAGICAAPRARAQPAPAAVSFTIAPGDTWPALAWRASLTPHELLAPLHGINPQRQPAIGAEVLLPAVPARNAQMLRPTGGGLLELAASRALSPWTVARQNGQAHPFRPTLGSPLFLAGGAQPPRDLPPGFLDLTLTPQPAQPGQALALFGRYDGAEQPAIDLEGTAWPAGRNADTVVALGATGAFYPPGQALLRIISPQGTAWEQPLQFAPGAWTFEQITFTGTAVFDQEQLRLERERLQAIWDEITPRPLWDGPFQPPLTDYVELSSLYGARRSVNGGPYSSYHEGTDYSAYGGTPVYAPAAGRVVLAEALAVRGGAVILDHGLGLHSGYYHLSAIHARPGQVVEPGDLLGEVGTTGRSTGNHLHWDLLVGRTWVDAQAWLAQDAAAQISALWPGPPPTPAPRDRRVPLP